GRPDWRGRIAPRGDDHLGPPSLQQCEGLRGAGCRQHHRPRKRPRQPSRPCPRGDAMKRPAGARHDLPFHAGTADKQDLRLRPQGDHGLGDGQPRVHVAPGAAPRDHDAHERSPTDGNGGTGERGNEEIRETTRVPPIRSPVWSAQRIPMFPRSRVPAFPQYCEIFSTIPIPIIAKSSDDPPKLTNGSGTPVIGRTPVVTPMLMMACRTIIRVMPPATRLPYRSGASRAMRRPRTARIPNNTSTATVPIRPSSSPRI